MPGFYWLPLILNGICLLHALRTGRDQKWLWLLIMLPGIGAVAYLLVEVLPNAHGPVIDLSRLPWFEKKRIAQLEAEIAWGAVEGYGKGERK